MHFSEKENNVFKNKILSNVRKDNEIFNFNLYGGPGIIDNNKEDLTNSNNNPFGYLDSYQDTEAIIKEEGDNIFNKSIYTNKNNDFEKKEDKQTCVSNSPDEIKENNMKHTYDLIAKARKNKSNKKVVKKSKSKRHDNLLRTIQVHFLNFVINFVNDVILTLSKKKKKVRLFNKLDYQIKSKVNHNYVEEIKKKNIGQILKLKVSPKMKKNKPNYNERIYEEILKNIPSIQELFEINYIQLFREYFTNKTNFFYFKEHYVHFSDKTKTYKDLLNKKIPFEAQLNYISKDYYLHCHERKKKPKFKINNINKRKICVNRKFIEENSKMEN